MTAARTELGRRAEEVAAALHEATCGAEVRIHPYPELGGASLETVRGEAYVLPETAGGFAMEAWHHNGHEAYRTQHTDTLAAAITAAIEAVLASDQRTRITAPTDGRRQQGEEVHHATPPPQH